jgi:hypothetical protein
LVGRRDPSPPWCSGEGTPLGWDNRDFRDERDRDDREKREKRDKRERRMPVEGVRHWEMASSPIA